MSIALRPSEITLPPGSWPSVLAFLCQHFHRIDAAIWQQRVADGKVHWFAGEPIDALTPYQPGRRLCYYREVPAEPKIAAAHQILFQNEHIIVACKPHGLPVTPGGEFVNECLLERVRRDTAVSDLAPVHRLDRDTAGLVLFSCNSQSRPLYYDLFASGAIDKQYRAVAQLPLGAACEFIAGRRWQVHNRLEKADPKFVTQVVAGEPNAHSTLQLLASCAAAPAQHQTAQWQTSDADTAQFAAASSAMLSPSVLGLFALTPHTGKTHQLRVHMAGIGAPLLGDTYYPTLLPKQPVAPDALPLQLLAQQLSFIDPLDGTQRQFVSTRRLAGWLGDWQ